MLPDHAVAELLGYEPRPGTHPNYFFWSKASNHLSLTTLWTSRIRELNSYLPFHDEKGRPMPFRSHMLRDTFAVELLLPGVALEDVSRLLTHKSVRIYTAYGSVLTHADYTYTAATLAAMITPIPGTILPGRDVTFT